MNYKDKISSGSRHDEKIKSQKLTDEKILITGRWITKIKLQVEVDMTETKNLTNYNKKLNLKHNWKIIGSTIGTKNSTN